MKEKIIVAVAAVVVIVLSVLSVHHYHQYKIQKQHSDATQLSTAKEQIARLQLGTTTLNKSWNDRYQNERLQCEKGLAAYDELSTALQAKTPAPVCGAAVVQ